MNRLMILDAHRLVFPAINFQKSNNSTISLEMAYEYRVLGEEKYLGF